ncbi:MAG: hypothetical protein OHK0046_01980 [Anaerolineae bacterium]
MLENISTFLTNLFLAAGLFCAAAVLLTLIAGYFFIRQLNSFTSPNMPKMLEEYTEQLRKNPNINRRQLMQRIIRRQSLKAGLVGAITGLGGFWTLPIALPADILISLRIQAATVDFIAAVYGHTQYNQVETRVRQYLITTGGVKAMESTTNYLTRLAVRLMGKWFSKLIPIISAVISFTVNYAFAQAGANIAMQWYAQKPNPNQPELVA